MWWTGTGGVYSISIVHIMRGNTRRGLDLCPNVDPKAPIIEKGTQVPDLAVA